MDMRMVGVYQFRANKCPESRSISGKDIHSTSVPYAYAQTDIRAAHPAIFEGLFHQTGLRRSRFWRIDFLLLGLGFSDSFGTTRAHLSIKHGSNAFPLYLY
jgi:hypothetical protein